MGLSLEFYAGDIDKMVAAVQKCDFALLENPDIASANADLSLHIEPADLNLLSREIGIATEQEPLDLRPYLSVLVDEDGYGALKVSAEWVKYASFVRPDATDHIAHRWADAMATCYPDEPIVHDIAMSRAVSDLVSLCQLAASKGKSVIHVWYQ